MITTTLNAIRAKSPCRGGWEKLLRHLGKTQADDEPLPFAVILEANGLAVTLKHCRAAPEHDPVWRMFAVRCARRALARIPDPDPRSVAAVDTAERYARGEATAAELGSARAAAVAARAPAERNARTTATANAWKPSAAVARAGAAAYAASTAANTTDTNTTAWAAAADSAAWAVYWASWPAAAIARNDECEAQARDFLELVS